MVQPGTPKLSLDDSLFDRAVDPNSKWTNFRIESGSAARSKRESSRDNLGVPGAAGAERRDVRAEGVPPGGPGGLLPAD
eukprot:289619-Prorocentrum_minimum.AAC.1